MLTIDPSKENTSVVQKYLLSAVVPRPVAFVSTMDEKGNPNLSPFSFFNAFSANPLVLVFSPAKRVKDSTPKHTLDNVQQTKEAVICVVNYKMAQQMSLASSDYPKGVNEFEKAGFTPVTSEKVAPFRVKESPVNFECKVNEVIELGTEGGAGNLVICEVLMMHINEDILDENNAIDHLKIDLISRFGGNCYGRTLEAGLFELEKPISRIGIGIDQLPDHIRNSGVLTGSELAILASVEQMPDFNREDIITKLPESGKLLKQYENDAKELKHHLHLLAKDLLQKGEAEKAWMALLVRFD